MRGAVFLLVATAQCAAQTLPDFASRDFAGTWVQKWDGRIFRVLTLRQESAGLAGSVTQPRHFTFNQDGDFSKISGETREYELKNLTIGGQRLEFAFDGERHSLTMADRDHALLLPLEEDYPLPPWKLERADQESARVADSWPKVKYPAEIVALQKRLHGMVAVDQKARMAAKVSFPEMERIDRSHLAEILRIHEKYGWPRISAMGREASHDYWLLVQHQGPEVQQKILPDLQRAAESGEASKSDFAYLYDRVQVGLGKPQRWGTQVSCKQGKPVLDAVEDAAGLDQRRKDLAMMPIERYMKMDYLVRMCALQPEVK